MRLHTALISSVKSFRHKVVLMALGMLVAHAGLPSAALAQARSGFRAAGGLAHTLGRLHALAARDGARSAGVGAAVRHDGRDVARGNGARLRRSAAASAC